MGARRRRAAALRKRRGPGENGGQVEAGARRLGEKAGPGGRVVGRAGPGRAGCAGPPRARREARGAREGSPSASREENPAWLMAFAARNVKCQRFSVVALLLCGDSGGQPERIRSALRVRGSPSASREENPAWLMAFAARNVKCQRFSVVALLLCGDSGGQPERIRSALRVRECQVPAFLRDRPSVVR
ncbi:uncharacterized protein FN964_016665 isoform 2-T6 [Alca torda]